MEEFKLFDAEYRFLDIIWELEPINSTELTKECLKRLGWKFFYYFDRQPLVQK